MKHLARFASFDSLEGGQFLYRNMPEINSELVDRLRGGESDKDEKTRIRESRKLAVNELSSFSVDRTNAINSGKEVDSESKEVKTLVSDTREKIFNVLEGYTASPDGYDAVIKDIKDTEANSVLTVGNVDRALTTLETLREGYEEKAKSVEETLKKEKEALGFFHRDLRNWNGDASKEKHSEKEIFSLRNGFVMNVFSELESQFKNLESSAGAQLEANKTKMRGRFEDLEGDEKQKFLLAVKDELNGTSPSSHLTDHGSYVLGEIPLIQRIEAYKALGWDQTDKQKILEENEQEMDFLREKNAKRRTEVLRIRPNFGKLKTALQENLSEYSETSEDLEGLMSGLRDFVDRYGSVNRKHILNQLQQKLEVNIYDEFLAYAEYLDSDPDALVSDKMPNDLKKQFLGYLNFLEGQDRSEKGEYSEGFIDLEDSMKNEFDSNEIFINGTLKNIKNVNDIDDNVLRDLEDRIIDNRHLINRLEQAKTKNVLSDSEAQILDKYLEKLKSVQQNLEALEMAWKVERKQFKKDKEAYKIKKNRLEKQAEINEEVKRTAMISSRGGAAGTAATVIANRVAKMEESEQEAILGLAQLEDITEAKYTITKVSDKSFGLRELELYKQEITNRGAVSNPYKTTKRRTLEYLQEESAKLNNEKLLGDMENNRKRSLDFLVASEIGTSFNLKYQEYTHGNPPTSGDFLDKTKDQGLARLTLLERTEKGAVLMDSAGDNLIFIQESEGGGVELISLPAPKNVLSEGFSKDFDPGYNYNYVAAPTSILMA